MVKEGVELVIFPGDLVNGWFYISTPYVDQFATWRKAMAPVYDAGIKVYPVRGNHENGPPYPLINFPWPPDVNATPVIVPIAELKAAYRTAFTDAWIPANGPAGEEGYTYSFVYKNAFEAKQTTAYFCLRPCPGVSGRAYRLIGLLSRGT
jgi:hypothetical protein